MKVHLGVVCLIVIALINNANAEPDPKPEPQWTKAAGTVAKEVLKWGAYLLAALPWGRKQTPPPLQPSQMGFPGHPAAG